MTVGMICEGAGTVALGGRSHEIILKLSFLLNFTVRNFHSTKLLRSELDDRCLSRLNTTKIVQWL